MLNLCNLGLSLIEIKEIKSFTKIFFYILLSTSKYVALIKPLMYDELLNLLFCEETSMSPCSYASSF